MGKAMFQITGATDHGVISGLLTQPDASTVELTVDTPVELESSGDYRLELRVTGFIPMTVEFAVKTGTTNSTMRPKNDLLPLCATLVRQRFVDKQTGEQSDSLFLLRCDFGYARELVLVAGADYDEKGVDFEALAKTRRNDQLKEETKSIDAVACTSTQVTQFSFSTGQRLTFMLRSPTRWMVVDSRNYGAPAPGAQSPDGLSITDVYDWIVAAGQAQAGRVVEFSIFSNARQTGPILVNTKDECTGNERDPNDHDCRLKDFNGKNLDVAAFGRAFADSAQCHVFGCFMVEVHNWCAKAIRNERPDDAERTYRIRQATGGDMKLTWDQCKEALEIGLERNYGSRLAAAVGVAVWAGAPGAASVIMRKGKRRYLAMDSRQYGDTIKSVADAFEREQNDRGYIKYLKVVSRNEISGQSCRAENPASDQSEPEDGQAQQQEQTPANQPTQATENLKIITPSEDRKQFVNLDPHGDHPEYGRVVRVEVQLDPPAAGTPIHWAFEGESQFKSELPPDGVAGFGYALSETVITNTDSRGIAAVDFNLSICGGDFFRVTAGRQAGRTEVGSGTLTVWRKLWYEVDSMKKSALQGGHFSLQHQSAVHAQFARVFIDASRYGRDNHFDNQPVVDAQALMAGLGQEYFSAGKAPHQAHLLAIDHFAEKKRVEIQYEADKTVYCTPATGPFYGYGGGKSWLVKALYQEIGGAAKHLDNGLVSLKGVDGDYARQIQVDFSTTTIRPTPQRKVIVAFQMWHSLERWGGATGFHAYVAMGAVDDFGTELLGASGVEKQVLTTVVHELAHLFGMVPRDSPSYVLTGPGQNHCSDTRCLMYMSEHKDSTGRFCTHCIKVFRKTDLSRYVHKFQATKGAKA